MTIYKPIQPLASRAAESAMKLAKGEKVESIKAKIGEYETNAMFLAPLVVDKSNYNETVVKDGHVNLSEVLDKK